MRRTGPAAEVRHPDEHLDTCAPYPRHARIEQLVLAWADEHPQRTAVVDGSSISYGQLASWSAQIASRLITAGVGTGDVVALHLARGAAFAASALAILRIGAVYLPVDPAHPDERVAYQLDDGGVAAVVTAAVEGQRAVLDTAGVPIIAPGQSDSAAPADVVAGTSAVDPAYLMYTSGTTGRPKGVLVPHRAVVRLAYDTDHARLGPDTVMAHIGATSFDASVWELWGTLINGGTLQVLSTETALDADEFGRAIADRAITTGLITSALFTHLADTDPLMFAPMRELLVGGDVLSPAHAQAVLAACPQLRLMNAYGPTENGVISTVHRVGPAEKDLRVPIGRPIRNSTAYVVTEAGELQKPGQPGELWVGGDGLAIGYHRRPDLTAAAFVEAPFAPGTRLYRTGDRVVQRPDGTIDFVGRSDGQLKIRGQRVELGEVENTLIMVDGAEEAVVLADKSVPGEPVLRAFVTGAVEESAVRDEMARRVPAYLVPSFFIVLQRFPLTAHGKVDRAALAALPMSPSRTRSPRETLTPAQEQVAQIWRQVLDVPSIGAQDTVLTLGGSSLAATRITSLLRARTGRNCRVAWVLTDDLATLAAKIDDAQPGEPIQRDDAAHEPGLPLLPQQSAVLTEALLRPGDLGYNLPVLIETAQPLRAADVVAALTRLRSRHGALRTVVVARPDGSYRQEVGPDAESGLPFEELPADDLDTVLRSWVRPFDLENGPLWRAALINGQTRSALVVDAHHLIADGWSLRVLLEELAALLAAKPVRTVAAPPYEQVVREALALHSSDLQQAALPVPASRPDLPLDRARPALRSTTGAWTRHNLGPERSSAVRQCARLLGTAPFAVYLAALGVVLARVTGSDHATIAVPFSGRHVAGGDRAVGMLVATHALQVRVGVAEPFSAVVRSVAAAAAETADLPQRFSPSVTGAERDRHPVADVLFALQDTGLADVDLAGGRPQWRPELTGAVLFDLALHIEPNPHADVALWGFATAVLDQGTVDALHEELTAVLDTALADPHRQVASLAAAVPVPEAHLEFSFDL